MTVGVAQPLRWLGGPVDVRVEVDSPLDALDFAVWDSSLWDVGTWGTADPLWADLSPFVESVTINRGRDRWQDRFAAGVAAFNLDNTTGVFSPTTTEPETDWGRWEIGQWDAAQWGNRVADESPWYLPWRPGRRIRVVAVPDPDDDPNDPAAKVPLFTGTIDSIADEFNEGGYWVRSVVVAADSLADLAQNDPPALETPTGVESTDDRIRSALARFGQIGWTGETDIDVGFHSMQSSHLAQSTLEECQRAAEAEGGAFYALADGTLVFRNRDWLSEAPRSVAVQAWIGYPAANAPPGAVLAHVIDATTSWELARIRNHVALARAGGTVVDAEDAESIALYGRRTHRRLDYQNNAQSQIEFLAARMLSALKANRLRVDSVTVAAVADDPEHSRILWDTQIGDLVAVRLQSGHGWGYSRPAHVMGETHHITGEDWTKTLRLDDATFYLST